MNKQEESTCIQKRLQEVSLLLEGNGPTFLDVKHLVAYLCKSMYSPCSMALNPS